MDNLKEWVKAQQDNGNDKICSIDTDLSDNQ